MPWGGDSWEKGEGGGERKRVVEVVVLALVRIYKGPGGTGECGGGRRTIVG